MDKAIEEIKKRWENIEVELSKGSSLCLQIGDDCWQDIQTLLNALQVAKEENQRLQRLYLLNLQEAREKIHALATQRIEDLEDDLGKTGEIFREALKNIMER